MTRLATDLAAERHDDAAAYVAQAAVDLVRSITDRKLIQYDAGESERLRCQLDPESLEELEERIAAWERASEIVLAVDAAFGRGSLGRPPSATSIDPLVEQAYKEGREVYEATKDRVEAPMNRRAGSS